MSTCPRCAACSRQSVHTLTQHQMAGVDLSDATRLFDAEQAHDRGAAQGEYEPLRPDGEEWDAEDDEPNTRPVARSVDGADS